MSDCYPESALLNQRPVDLSYEARAKIQERIAELKEAREAERIANELPRTCVTCKHLLGKRDSLDKAADNWRCHHPSNIFTIKMDMVTGAKLHVYNVQDIYTVRMPIGKCKVEGINWELYTPPVTRYFEQPQEMQKQPAKRKQSAIDLGDI